MCSPFLMVRCERKEMLGCRLLKPSILSVLFFLFIVAALNYSIGQCRCEPRALANMQRDV